MPISRETGRPGKVTGVGTGKSTIVYTNLSKATTQGGPSQILEDQNSKIGFFHRMTGFCDEGDTCFDVTPEGDGKNDLPLNLDVICENVTGENEPSSKTIKLVGNRVEFGVKKSGFITKIDATKDYHKKMMTFDQIDEQEELDLRFHAESSKGSIQSKRTIKQNIGSPVLRNEKTGNSDFSRAEASKFSSVDTANPPQGETSSQNCPRDKSGVA
jgi:hypothetical protein